MCTIKGVAGDGGDHTEGDLSHHKIVQKELDSGIAALLKITGYAAAIFLAEILAKIWFHR